MLPQFLEDFSSDVFNYLICAIALYGVTLKHPIWLEVDIFCLYMENINSVT